MELVITERVSLSALVLNLQSHLRHSIKIYTGLQLKVNFIWAQFNPQLYTKLTQVSRKWRTVAALSI